MIGMGLLRRMLGRGRGFEGGFSGSSLWGVVFAGVFAWIDVKRAGCSVLLFTLVCVEVLGCRCRCCRYLSPSFLMGWARHRST